MRVRNDLAVGEFAHLVADLFERLVHAAVARGRGVVSADQLGQPGAIGGRIAGRRQRFERRTEPRRHVGRVEAEIDRTHEFALAYRDAPDHLRQIFAEPDAHDQFLDLVETPRLAHAGGIDRELPHRLRIGCEPGKPMRGALLAVEQACRNPPLRRNARAHLVDCIGQDRFERPGGFMSDADEIGNRFCTQRSNCHGNLRKSRFRAAANDYFNAPKPSSRQGRTVVFARDPPAPKDLAKPASIGKG